MTNDSGGQMTQKSVVSEQEWLTLSQAAKRLNVHATTLRRWSDNGKIPVMITPGGHRRFAVADVENFSTGSRSIRIPSTNVEKEWANAALTRTREEITEQQSQAWLASIDEDVRVRSREIGRRLMGLILQYLSDPQDAQRFIEEASKIGHEYGVNFQTSGMPLKDAVQAWMFFRDMLVETALNMPDTLHVRPESNLRLVQHINQLLNSVHLAIVEIYEQSTN